MEKFINEFYDVPRNVNDADIDLIEKILGELKREIIGNKYLLFIGDRDIIVKLFIIYLYYFSFIISNQKEKKHHVAIDFEFNKQKIALMQINFGEHVWIIDPRKYTEKYVKIIAEQLFLNDNIYKVLHGADSLDLPYVYNEILYDNKDDIIRMTKKLIDTRFLCEYTRHSKSEEGKCSIYNAMLYFDTITKTKFDDLEKINDSMGPVQNVMWDVDHLTKYHIEYAYYDVLYLNDFLVNIYKKVIRETPNLVRSYYYIMEIIRFVLLERRGVTNVIGTQNFSNYSSPSSKEVGQLSKNIVNKMNNYSIKHNNENVTLVNLYEIVMDGYILKDGDKIVDLNFLVSNNYIKGVFPFVLKHVFYYVISINFKIQKNKTELLTETFNLKQLYSALSDAKMLKILKLLKLYEKDITKNSKYIEFFIE